MVRTAHADRWRVKVGRTIVQGMLKRIRRHGFVRALYHLAMRLLTALLEVRILCAVRLESTDPAFLECPEPFVAGFVPDGEVSELARDPNLELSASFVHDALERGDKCYGVRDDCGLASYSWYARGRTPMAPELDILFSTDYVYMYKAFTDPRCRGQRLHAIAKAGALRHFLSQGYRGLVCYVESTNLDSLKACRRMGCEVFGVVFLVRLLGRWWTFASPGCRACGFSIAWAPRTLPSSVMARPQMG